jgi:hypothetical protein
MENSLTRRGWQRLTGEAERLDPMRRWLFAVHRKDGGDQGSGWWSRIGRRKGGRWLADDLAWRRTGAAGELFAAGRKNGDERDALVLMGAEAREWLEGETGSWRKRRAATGPSRSATEARVRLTSGPSATKCPLLFIQMIFKWIQI